MELPQSFDEYLASRSAWARKSYRAALRRLERVGGHVAEVLPKDHSRKLEDFVRVHTLRARSKRERHAEVDERLGRLLSAMSQARAVTLRVFELRFNDDTAGVYVRLDRGTTAHAYNYGFDPAIAYLSPGTVMSVISIRDALERGIRTYDFGPGGSTPKYRFGGIQSERYDVRATSSSLRGSVVAAVNDRYRSARRYLSPAGRLARRVAPG